SLINSPQYLTTSGAHALRSLSVPSPSGLAGGGGGDCACAAAAVSKRAIMQNVRSISPSLSIPATRRAPISHSFLTGHCPERQPTTHDVRRVVKARRVSARAQTRRGRSQGQSRKAWVLWPLPPV